MAPFFFSHRWNKNPMPRRSSPKKTRQSKRSQRRARSMRRYRGSKHKYRSSYVWSEDEKKIYMLRREEMEKNFNWSGDAPGTVYNLDDGDGFYYDNMKRFIDGSHGSSPASVGTVGLRRAWPDNTQWHPDQKNANKRCHDPITWIANEGRPGGYHIFPYRWPDAVGGGDVKPDDPPVKFTDA